MPLPTSSRALRAAALALLPAAALAVAACRDVTVPVEDPARTTFAPSLNVNLAGMTRTASGLYYRDLATSSGAVADTGKSVTAYYIGRLTDGRVFDQNQDTGRPFGPFRLGAGAVIKGWDEGIRGMRVGGRRQLVIPPHLGYGNRTSGSIPAGSVLVFEVTLVSVTTPTS